MDKLGYKSFNLISESTLHSVPHGSWILLHPFFFSCPTSWHVGSYFTSQWSKLGPLQWKAQSPNHWTAREFLCSILDWITWLGSLVTCIFFFLNHKKIILIFYSYMSYHSYIQWKYFKLFTLWMQLRLSILVIYWKTNMWKVHYNSMLSHFSCVWLFATLWTVCSLPGSLVHGLLQARIMEWVAMPSSRGSSEPRDQTCNPYVSCIGRWVLHHHCHLGSPPPHL